MLLYSHNTFCKQRKKTDICKHVILLIQLELVATYSQQNTSSIRKLLDKGFFLI